MASCRRRYLHLRGADCRLVGIRVVKSEGPARRHTLPLPQDHMSVRDGRRSAAQSAPPSVHAILALRAMGTALIDRIQIRAKAAPIRAHSHLRTLLQRAGRTNYLA